ncbi:MAG: sensor histidine kinase [Streptosporangiaceae bacterium]
MTTSTAAEIAEREEGRFENARLLTFWSFSVASLAVEAIPGLTLVTDALAGKVHPVTAVLAFLGLVAFTVLYGRVLKGALAGVMPVADLVRSGTLALALTAMIFISAQWVIIGMVWVAGAALCMRSRRQIVVLCLGVGAITALVSTVAAGEKAHWYMWPTMFALLSVVGGVAATANLVQKSMWDLFKDAHEAREAQARLAVAEERLRIARDLHDLLGHNLSLIAVKSELAVRLAPSDVARAQAEMVDVRQAARAALREVRATLRGYRDIEFDAEVAGIRAVLQAAGVRCTVGPVPPLPPAVRGVLAWVVREATTNVLKHSAAEHCELTVELSGASVRLTMANDRAHPPVPGDGVGLLGMRERVTALGGTLTGESDGRGGFVLRACLPLQEQAVKFTS